MSAFQVANVQSILCIGAHSDDIEIGCGGALLDLVAAHPDARIHWCVFSGSEQRDQETRESAARFIGAAESHSIEIHAFRDSFFPEQWGQIKETFAEVAQRVQPDLIFSHRLEDRHQDHRVLAELTWCAFRRHLILEYEIPKYEGDLGQPNLFWPLSQEITERKIAYLLEGFPSQVTKPWFDADLFRATLRLRGSESQSMERYAEGFYCRKASIQVV